MSRVPIHDHSNIHQGGKIRATTGITGADLTGGSGGGSSGGSGGGGSSVVNLDDLNDVVLTSPVEGDRLRFDGTRWVNSAAVWVPVMVEDGATGLWYVTVTGDGDAVMTEVS